MPEAAAHHDSPDRALIDELKAAIQRKHAPPFVKRDAHPKMHGCVQAELIVDASVPESLRHGVLARPHRYRAWVRFSNAFRLDHDMTADPRGIAVKLLDVDGDHLDPIDDERSTQDFLLVTHDAFFLSNPVGYLQLIHAIERGGLPVIRFFLANRRRWRGGWALLKSRVRPRTPLEARYFSQTAYALGPDRKVKLQLAPVLTPELTRSLPNAVAFRLKGLAIALVLMLPNVRVARFLLGFAGITITPAWAQHVSDRIAPRDLLRHALMAFLSSHEAAFDLLVQPFVDESTTPIEDAARSWSQRKTPFVKVARLRIPRQVFWPEPGMPPDVARAAATMADLGENMSFTPWHGLRAHEPLGAINRLRAAVYREIAAFRRAQNHVAAQATIEVQRAESFDKLRRVAQSTTELPAVTYAGVNAR